MYSSHSSTPTVLAVGTLRACARCLPRAYASFVPRVFEATGAKPVRGAGPASCRRQNCLLPIRSKLTIEGPVSVGNSEPASANTAAALVKPCGSGVSAAGTIRYLTAKLTIRLFIVVCRPQQSSPTGHNVLYFSDVISYKLPSHKRIVGIVRHEAR